MPIKSFVDNLHSKTEFSIGRDVELHFCSDTCLLSDLDDRSRVVRTGQTDATALTVILGEDRLLVPLAGARRADAHILGAQNGYERGRENWEKLVGCRHSALMPVYRVCDCMAEVQILDGEAFEDAATTPAWKKVRGIVGKAPSIGLKNQPVAFDQWRSWMGELANGLDELEKMGLAHGDPYPFNAICTGSGAAWVDFGHLTNDPAQHFKDAWAFVLFTVLHTLGKSRAYSPALLKNLAAALVEAEQPGRFDRVRQTLSESYSDVVSISDARVPSLIFAEAVAEQSQKIFQNPDLSKLLLKSAVQYFSDFLHHIQRGNQYFAGFNFEKQRHHFVEQEMLRLTVPLAEHRSQIASLNQAVAERDGRLSDLNRVVEEHGAHVLHLTQAANSYYEHLTKLLASRSWKITRPMRAVAHFIKWGGLTNSDRGRLYKHAKRIYHRFPVSYETKLLFKKYFLKMTGWTPATLVIANAANAMRVTPAVAVVPGVVGGAATQISESVSRLGTLLQCQTGDNRIPYFGVRRQEGRRSVAILTNQLLDWSDGRPRFGGGERYALELARLLKELSFDVTFYQPSFHAPGEGEYYGFKVVLLRTADSIGEFHHGLCTEFTELTKDFDHVYYHLPEHASGKVREDGLMTCHGIWFDHNNYPDSIFRTPEWFQQLYSAFSSPRCVVSVDTNSIGVIRSLWPELTAKMRFIPNFYDATLYFPRPELRNQERLTILFPRRSQINRGSRIFGEIVSLLPQGVEIIWLGEGDPVDTQIVKDVCKKDPRASFAVADFDQMPQWYQKADIAVIPTIACEGTSLSCLEALAAGCAVVSTNVGGLPDLVYDGMNGLLVDPDARSIAAAINRLIIDRELRERLQRSASETAHHFELKNWRERWVDVLHDCGWVSDRAIDTWKVQQGCRGLFKTRQSDKWLILTRNAIHGGVESLIREEAKGLKAPVVVCGGHDRKDNCPFEYTRADNPKTLERVITEYNIILYHWLPDWCLDVLRRSGKRCIEFVHRTDTADSDKTVPTALVTHSAFLARYIHEASGRSCRVVDHPIAIDRFKPHRLKGQFVGAITSYYDTKGIDIFLQAWAEIKNRFPDYGVRFYGVGDDLPKFRKLACDLGLDVDFRDATREPWEAMKDFACFVVPSRIEGLPVAILEALAMNIPVVASDLPGMVEFNQLSEARGYARFVHLARTEDPQDFAAVMSQILERSIEHNSSAYINDYYSPEKHCTDLVSIYRELCH
ncbi:MAG TPA: glycosyltransferase family 4 protein [Nitrosomonas mobilis]|nr:glycosyltransferase family 4 protein [Nitrosomonas mobilis]